MKKSFRKKGVKKYIIIGTIIIGVFILALILFLFYFTNQCSSKNDIECVIKNAIRLNDPSICKSFSNATNRDLDYCYHYYAIDTGNYDACELLINNKEDCYLDMAKLYNDYRFCVLINNTELTIGCITNYAIDSNNISACNEIIPEKNGTSYLFEERIICVTMVALEYQNPKACELFEAPSEVIKGYKEFCHDSYIIYENRTYWKEEFLKSENITINGSE
jgi:hypothetical protein